MTVKNQKYALIEKVSNSAGIISALAFDQRGALKKMMAKYQDTEPTAEDMEVLKSIVSEKLTPYSSSILLDPEYGLPASHIRASQSGLLLAYEKTGYDVSSTSRLPDCLVEWSVKRLKKEGADAIKFLLYYDIDGDPYVNLQKHAYIERLGSECAAEGLPFFLEILSYDEQIQDTNGPEFAKIKPRKVIEAMRVFSDECFGVDVLKVEVPVNMAYVEGFAQGNEIVYTKEEAAAYFQQQDAATPLPYIYLSAGVSATLFQETLKFAHESGAAFNGVLCGRATWADSVQIYMEEGEEAARNWLRTQGRQNIESLNEVLATTASSWKKRVHLHS
ncbi:tagatose-bisphosphate aldolase [Streptococcus sp. 19428wC2_LYSM12]|uniref:tagatose-bisphosphate aldolase n=1 Tax=unclassified Streptococcus TaxID=2608887 RepID=UPI0010716216|nr:MULTISPECIES: tagatose-bisphosphate aldolase [unclassified Streptococcus]MBF0787019.1 tagatose-bisphosphate aldolase [Streptococcus sp. 19428wC2_LYSM12]TFV06056.1 tagatose-bisphosphate aldolase [Streptococcus sp. LYSM12]